MRPFVHLHVHSEYSMLDGYARIKDLVSKAVEYEQKALAITDHANMFAAVMQINACRKAGIKPILGCTFYLAKDKHTDQKGFNGTKKLEKDEYHLVLLAKNQDGYVNLCKLISTAYKDGYYNRPRVDKELLAKYSDGLICLTASVGGEVNQHLSAEKYDHALEAARWYRDLYGAEHFFIELQNHRQPLNQKLLPQLIQIARELNVGVVATNDVHYVNQQDWDAHDMLICIQMNAQVKDPNRWRFPPGGHHYFKSGDEMMELFPDLEEALDNTVKIADMVEFEIKEDYQLPAFEIPEEHTTESYFAEVVKQGFEVRRKRILDPMKEAGTLVENDWDVYYRRLDEEIKVINDMGFPGYFLITWDFIRASKEMGVPVGPGRGSAAGSLVAYSLEITDIDPLQYDLLFERFLNKERVTMPDIDIDFCQYRRGEAIDYVTEKYGRENVCQIVTYGTMKAKLALKDVGRAMGFAPTETNRITKLVPDDLGMTLSKALVESEDFKKEYDDDPRIHALIDMSMRIEGLSRNTGVHAAGVIIAPGDVTNWAPLNKDPKKGTLSVQYAKDESEQIGLLKMDFLGLKTLTVISKTLEIIKETTGDEVDLEKITSFDDDPTFKLFGRGETDGVFQFESDGMKNILIRLGPKRFEDFIALNALYRPGPLGSGMVDVFIDGAHGKRKVEYKLEVLKPLLEETYGVILYQEQVMKIAQLVGGFSLAEADNLRRAMGKKKIEIMEKKKVEFMAGAAERGYDPDACDEIFDQMAEFAKYGFNKSHSAAYSLISYQTAYLKANYPVQFMAALLTLDKDNTDKVVNYIDKCRQKKIRTLMPDIRTSKRDFTVEGGHIRFALGAIKGVGDSALVSMMADPERETLENFTAFFEKMDLKKINKKVVEQLVKSGAFDFSGHTRKGMFDAIEELLSWGVKAQKEASGGQEALFADEPTLSCPVSIGEEEWELKEKLDFEKEALGLFLSGHPLDDYRDLLRKHASCDTGDLARLKDGSEVVLGGMIQSIRKIKTQKGDWMAFVNLEDYKGIADCTIFPRTYEKLKEKLLEDGMVVFKGKLQFRNDRANVLVDELFDLSDWESQKVRTCMIRFNTQQVSETHMKLLDEHLKTNKGETQVFFELQVNGSYRTVIRPQNLHINPGRPLTEFCKANPVFTMQLRY